MERLRGQPRSWVFPVRGSVVLDSSFPPNWLSHSRLHNPELERELWSSLSSACLSIPQPSQGGSRRKQAAPSSPSENWVRPKAKMTGEYTTGSSPAQEFLF